MLVVVLAATIIVGIISCEKKDKKEPIVDDGPVSSSLIMGRWHSPKIGDVRTIEFKPDGTYFIETSNIRAEGSYNIIESQKTKFIDLTEDEYDATLFKMNVSENNNFDQLWVYYFVPRFGQIIVDIYSNNELLDKNTFAYSRYE